MGDANGAGEKAPKIYETVANAAGSVIDEGVGFYQFSKNSLGNAMGEMTNPYQMGNGYVGMSKLTSLNGNHKLSIKYRFLSIFLPSLVHGFYDFCLYSQNLFLLFIFIGFLIFIYVGAIQKIKQFKRVKINL